MDLQTAAEALELGLEHFDLPCLAALSTTNKYWHAKVQAALHAVAPPAAQQLLLQIAGDGNSRVPPVALLKHLMERASSIADGAADVECFATALAIKVVSQPGITLTQAQVWLSSGLQLSDATIFAAARSPSTRPGMWVYYHGQMLPGTAGHLPLSPMLQALCKGHNKVGFTW
jgi:hypothetical protein